MPLDTGEIAGAADISVSDQSRLDDNIAGLRPRKVVLAREGHVGQALRAARESLGLAEEDIAQVTRVRAAYIGAIEALDFAALPARPFVVGYVRAYAQALGVDAEAAVARFHSEAPKVDGKLRPPGGVRHDAFATIRWLLIVSALVASAVGAWNLARRAQLRAETPAVPAASRSAPAHATVGPARIGAPLPTPPEATTPAVYQTPGIVPAGGGAAERAPARSDALVDPSADGVGQPFHAQGSVYGASARDAAVILQARKTITLIVRRAGGAIDFARVLNPGEAWGVTRPPGLTAEVSNPDATEAFVAGTSRGRLTHVQTPLSEIPLQ
jgi:transcriptional regulator with XRE-family HTH domain